MDFIQQIYMFVLGGSASAILTFILQRYGCSAVVASCIVGLVGAMLGYIFKSSHLPIIIFAGSFVGMTSANVGSIALVGFAGAIAGLFYKFSLKFFAGFGGRLGTIAFISTLIVVLYVTIAKKITS